MARLQAARKTGMGRPPIGKTAMTAAEGVQRRRLAARLEREREEQERRDRVVAQFNSDLHAMAVEILRYRHAVTQMTDAIHWMQAGAPFIAMGPGPYWQPPSAHDKKGP
jgi:hypothetical protein